MNNNEYKMPRSFYIKKNFSWQLLQNGITMVFPLVIRTLFVCKIGDEFLGLNSLFTSIVATLQVANFGMENVLVGRMYRPIEEDDTEEVCRQLKFCRSIYRIIGTVILVSGLVIMPFLKNFISGEIPDTNIYMVFAIYLFNTVIGYWLFGYYTVVFNATQQVYYLSRNITIGFVLQYVLQIAMLFMHNYFAYVCLLPVCTIFYNVSTYRNLRQEYPEYQCRGITDKASFKLLKKNIITSAIYKLRDSSRDSLDSVIISAVLGLVILSKYQNYITVLAVPLTLSKVITGTITPSLGNFNVTASKKEQFDLVKRLWLLEITVSGLFSICYFQMIQNFIVIWLGEDHVLQLPIAGILSLYLFVLGICDFFRMIRQTNLLWEKGKEIACVEMIVNLVLDVILARWFGVFGIVLATVITIVLITIPYELWLIARDFFKQDVKRFLWLLIKAICWIVITNGIVWSIVNAVPHYKYISVLIQAFFSVGIAGILFFLFFYMDEECKFLLKLVYKNSIKKKGISK